MYDIICRWFEWVRALPAPGRHRPSTVETPGHPTSEPQPPTPAEPPRTGQAQGNTCGVYLWATAHGIDLKPSSPLASCDC
ncbi:hypothetical protein [Streptomyces sp. NPDC051173]|uniref:hypothetical protein n=1 Tax=Streptomyces sp. NPDC051173 TaxID=3155164 RepID=UPI003450C268